MQVYHEFNRFSKNILLSLPLRADGQAAGMHFREYRTLQTEVIFRFKVLDRCRSSRLSPGSQDSLGQMAGHRRLFTNLPWQWVKLRKWLAYEHAVEAPPGYVSVGDPGCPWGQPEPWRPGNSEWDPPAGSIPAGVGCFPGLTRIGGGADFDGSGFLQFCLV